MTQEQYWGSDYDAVTMLGHLLATDRGRWCTEDGKQWAYDMEQLVRPIPQGWVVSDNWHTIGTDMEPDGWQYSTDFSSPYWCVEMS